MRQRWIWGIAALWLVAGAALWSSGVPCSVMKRMAASIARCTPAAHAGETLKFHPVSAESAARLQPGAGPSHRVRHTASDSAEALPVPSAAPEAPEAPEAPPAPHAGELMRIGSDITVDKDQTVEGDVVAISGDVHVYGHVKGSVQALGGDVYLASTARVDGDVAAVRGELHEDPGAFVGGQRVTALSRQRVHDEARHIVDDMVHAHDRRWIHMMGFANSLVWLLVMVGLAWLILRIAEARTGEALSVLRRETAAALGIGLLTWVLIVPSLVALALVVAVLCITIIGIPVALAALFAYGVILVVLVVWGFVIGAAWLGRQMDRGPAGGSLLRHALIGTVAVIGARTLGHLLSVVPVFGFLGGFLRVISWIVGGILITLGAGALLRSEFASGLLGRWWRGWRATPPAVAAGAAAPPAPAVPAASAEPSAIPPPTAPPMPPAAGDPGPGGPPASA